MDWIAKAWTAVFGSLVGGLLLVCSVAVPPAGGPAGAAGPPLAVETSSPPVARAAPTVPAAEPKTLVVSSIGVDAGVEPYTLAQAETGYNGFTGTGCYDPTTNTITCISPPNDHIVSWQRPIAGINGIGLGASPGTDATGTVYLYGHSTAGTSDGVFQNLSKLRPGELATISTEHGTLDYAVQRVVHLPKQDYYCPDATHAANAYTSLLCTQVPGRLLLISCDHDPGARLVNGGYAVTNTVAVLFLQSAIPR